MSVPFLDLARDTAVVGGELESAAARVIRSGRYVLGPEVERFEGRFAEYVGAGHCVSVGNGLDAIRLTLQASGIGPGDEVIVPANTFIATWLAVTQVGATPVAADPDEGTCNISAATVEAALSPRTAAVIAVHLYGQPADMTSVRRITDRLGLALVEDAAQAHGARWRGERIGSSGTVAWSFYPTKNLGALGDAGAVTTNDSGLADRLRMLRNYGSRQKYQSELSGTNSRLDELQAAMLSVKLDYLDAWNARRARIADTYTCRFAAARGIRLPLVLPEAEHVWHLFVVRSADRDALRAHLSRRGVETLVHYPIPPYRQGAYREGGYIAGPVPVSDLLHEEVLSLPMSPFLEDAEVELVAEAVIEFAGS